MNACLTWNLIDPRVVVDGKMQGASPAPPLKDAQWHHVQVKGGEFRFRFGKISGGPRDGVEVLEVATGRMIAIILASRGLSIWKAWLPDWELGWQSPVHGPIHPGLIRLDEPSGLGWLDGFDELVVRCGLESNGAPDFSPEGRLLYPLHGRIGNIPASRLSVEVDPSTGTLDVKGLVAENRFLIRALELEVNYRFHADQASIEATDIVHNRLSQPSSMQLLYHINVGAPLLEAGARVVAPMVELAPRDRRAAEGLQGWDTYAGPTPGYAEQVYFIRPLTDAQGWATAWLVNATQTRACEVSFDSQTLPYLNLWKNTAAIEDGYVTGLEPATGFPNPRSFEERQGRVVSLEPKASRVHRWSLRAWDDSASIRTRLAEIQQLQASVAATIHPQPRPDWSGSA
jgi:hypothetical protein